MKKLLCLVLLATMIVGCSSKEKEEDKVGANSNLITQMLDDVDNNKKDGEKDTPSTTDEEKKDNGANDGGTEAKTDETTKPKDNNSNQNSGGSSSGGRNNTSQEKPVTPTPPKEEKPTPPVETPAPPINQQAKADQVFAQINAYRQQNGKEPFAYSSLLKSQSDAHALAMATREALWHSGGAAECITNYDDPFNAWKNSPAHNEILLCNNTEAAVGIYYYNGYYYSVFQCQW
ncbi:CAP domain-containing protein [Amedibacillus sp. YH-ame6]